MLALITFLQTPAVIVCITYCLMHLSALYSLVDREIVIRAKGWPSQRKPNIPLYVAEDVSLGLGRTISGFPILREANHASVE